MRNENDNTLYEYDILTPGHKVKIEHNVYSNENADLSDLLKLTVGDISALKEKNIAQEQAAYEKAIDALRIGKRLRQIRENMKRRLIIKMCRRFRIPQTNGKRTALTGLP